MIPGCPFTFREGDGSPMFLDGRWWCEGWITLGISPLRRRCPEDCIFDMGEWGAWRSVAAQIERRDGCVEWCLALPRNMDRFRVVFFNIRVGARAVGWTPTNASAAWRAFANQIADYENDLDWTLVVPRRLEQTRDAYFDVGIAADAIGWPVPSAPATHCDKKKLRTFLLRQKTAAYEQGMAASAEGDTRTFNAGYDIVHFLDWFIYLKLDSGMFDIREDEP